MTVEATPTNEGTPNDDGAAAAALAAAEAAKAGAGGTPTKIDGLEAPKTPEAKPTPEAAKPYEDGFAGFASTNDTHLDTALKFVADQGFRPGDPALVSAVNGDFSLLRAKLAEKGAPGAEAYMALAEQAYKRIDSDNKARQQADKEAVHAIAGGEEQFTAAAEAFKSVASETEQEVVKGWLAQGGESAKMAARLIVLMKQGTPVEQAPTEGAGKPVAATAGQPTAASDTLDARAYSKAVQEARQKYNGNVPFDSSPEYAKLQDRRRRHKG